MKRYAALLLVFALLAGAAYYAVLSKSAALSSEIQAYQKTLYGDPAAAEDLEITFQTSYETVNTQWTSTFSDDKFLSTEISKYDRRLDMFLSSQSSDTVKDVLLYSFLYDENYVSVSDEDRISGVVKQYGINYWSSDKKSALNNVTVSPALKTCFFLQKSEISSEMNSLIESMSETNSYTSETKKNPERASREIYAFSYAGNEDTDETNDEDFNPELKAVYQLDQGKSIEKIAVNRAQTELLVFTQENGAIYLTRLDINSMDVLQTLYLFETSDRNTFQWAKDLSGGIAVLTDTRLHVFTEENGVYAHAISVETDKLFSNDQADWMHSFDDDVQPLDILKITESLSYKNGKLALAFEHSNTTYECGEKQEVFYGVWVLVCDENALLYRGLYYDTILLSKDWNDYYWLKQVAGASWIPKPSFRVRWQ